jgi:hypothetical protein
MGERSDGRWRFAAKWLRIIGGVFFIGLFLSYLAIVEVYYPSHRPDTPQTQGGYTVGLTWTHPVRYGTRQDENRSQWLFELGLLGLGLIAAAELIKIYRLGDYSGAAASLESALGS